MAIAIITAWLNNPIRTYDQGKMLYDQYGTDIFLKSLLNGGSEGSHYHFSKLNAALEALNESFTDLPAQSSQPVFKVPELKNIPVPANMHGLSDDEWQKLPERIKEIRMHNTQLHTHTQLIFNQLRTMRNPQSKQPLCKQLLLERRQINDNWKLIKEFEEKGTVRAAAVEKQKTGVDEMSTADLAKLKSNIPTYLSKDRKLLTPDLKPTRRDKIQKRIAENEALLSLVIAKLESK